MTVSVQSLALLALIVAALADVYTSHHVFKAGHVELNPVVAKLFGKRPSFGAMLAVKVMAFAVIARFGTPSMIFVAAGVWAAVAAHNHMLR